jgi:hypothetical protein
MDFAIAEARVLAASDRFDDANKILAGVIADARKLGLVRLELEARLASAEIATKSGSVKITRAQLATIEKDAAARGYIKLARSAANLQ